uniref:GrpE protein homolog, mitochondrial-like n=1 Tax=Drosophila rhopaloa TaxID=1041015 RepID=A0A6P4DVB5_DRORH
MTAKAALPLQMFGRRLVQLRSSVTAQNMSALRLYSTEKQPEEAAAAGAAEPKTPASSPELEKLTKDLAAAKEQNAELLDKYKRSLADSENMRNRLNKQISDAKIFGIQSFCKDLLEVADTLGHATQAVPKDKVGFSS